MTRQQQTADTAERKHSLVRRWSRKISLTALGLAMVTLGLLGGRPEPARAQQLQPGEIGSLAYVTGYTSTIIPHSCNLSYCSFNQTTNGGVVKLHAGEIIELRGTEANDNIHNIMLSPGNKVALYADSDLTGTCEVFTATHPEFFLYDPLFDNRIGDDTVSSIHVGADCGAPVARIYEHSNYGGMSRVLGTTSQYNPATGYYEIANLDAGSVDFNDAVSSIKLLPGQTIYVCQHANFGGNCAFLGGSVSNMGTIGLVGNDTISSIRFYKP